MGGKNRRKAQDVDACIQTGVDTDKETKTQHSNSEQNLRSLHFGQCCHTKLYESYRMSRSDVKLNDDYVIGDVSESGDK